MECRGLDYYASTINQQMHPYNFHLKHFKTLKTPQHVSIFSDHHQGVSSFLAKLLHIHYLVRFYKQGVVAAYHVV